LEMLVTLVLLSLVAVAVLGVLSRVSTQSETVQEDMARHASLQHSLDRLVADVRNMGQLGAAMEVEQEYFGALETCRLTMAPARTERGSGGGWQIDWVAVPRYQERDLLLFRREKKETAKEKELYIPVCEYLCTFRVELLDADGEVAGGTGGEASLVEVTAEVFRAGEPDRERVLKASRTCALKRF